VSTGPVRIPSIGALDQVPTPLLDLTLDQLRTLLAIHQAGSPLQAARLLGREHSSVRKQIDTLNRAFQQLCGEVLAVKQGRGQNHLFTPTGEAAVEISQRLFADWLAGITDRRRRLGATITVATTEFTIDFLSQIWPTVADEFAHRGVELNIVHVRTRDFRAQLDAKNVDVVCGSIAAPARSDLVMDAYDVIEWQRESLVLVTNLSTRELPPAPVSQDRLPGVPLLAPSAGLIADCLTRWYGPDHRDRLHLMANVDSIYYGLALLRSKLVHGAMLTTEAAGRAAAEGRLPGGPDLRLVPLADDFQPALEIVAGVFARVGERGHYDTSHPLNLLWKAFEEHARLDDHAVESAARTNES
jgi:DNA-binding transcriptional LysR family regulator